MIAKLKGFVDDIFISKAIINVGGVGYLVNLIPSFAISLENGKELSLYVHTAVRENDISLYGFGSLEELEMFEKLLSVSGIGPKSSLAILGVANLDTLEEAIVRNDINILTKVAGIGRKTAEKILLELKDKVVSRNNNSGVQENIDVLEALRSLGYHDNQIKEVIKNLPKEMSGTNDKIKEALKMLSKK
jgi:Holliday junction DNA helicase RuvA